MQRVLWKLKIARAHEAMSGCSRRAVSLPLPHAPAWRPPAIPVTLPRSSQDSTPAATLQGQPNRLSMLKVFGIGAALSLGVVLGGGGVLNKAYLLWALERPDLPEQVEPAVRVDMGNVEDKLFRLMKGSAKFVIVRGPDGSGKTTAVLSAAKKRGKGVMWLDARSAMDLAMADVFKLGDLWRWWCDKVRGDPVRRCLVVILDNADGVGDDKQLLRVGRMAERLASSDMVSVWCIISEKKALGMEMSISWVEGWMGAFNFWMPSIPESKLSDMALEALGEEGSRELADGLVYLSGSNLACLWDLIKEPIRWPVHLQQVDSLDLTGGKAKMFCKELVEGRNPAVAAHNLARLAPCLQTVAKCRKQTFRSNYCRDVISLMVAEAEAEEVSSSSGRADEVSIKAAAARAAGEIVEQKRAAILEAASNYQAAKKR